MAKKNEKTGAAIIRKFYEEQRQVDPEALTCTKQMTVKLNIEIASSLQGIAKAFFTDFSSLAEQILTAEFYEMAAALEEAEMIEASETARKLELEFYRSKGVIDYEPDVPFVEHVWRSWHGKSEGGNS